MKQLKQETGRSMVEMLGVLAVIGVLSVGGISGYTLAMNKHRANSVAADLMKRAVVISAQRQLGQQNPNMDGFGNTVGEYELTLPISTDNTNQTFGMTVQAVPEEVCEKILALDWDNATISPDKAEDCNGGDMTFTYNNDLSPVTGSGSTGGEGTDTPPEQKCEGAGNGCQKCEDGAWVADTGKNDQPCGAGVCTDGQCCQGETCAGEGEEVFCFNTNAEGECVSWETCNGEHTGDSIVGVSGAGGACAPEGYELYCSNTNAEGECEYWSTCDEGKSSKAWIVDVKTEYGARGACAWEDQEVYCYETNAEGDCLSVEICAEGKSSKDSIVGKEAPEYGGAGACAEEEGYEIFCSMTNADGDCFYWSICPVGQSTEAFGPNAQGTCNW